MNVSIFPPVQKVLPSVYDREAFSEEDFQAELQRIHDETAIDRQWMDEVELPTFETDDDILEAAKAGRLTEIRQGVGFIAIDRMLYWEPDRSNPEHKWHYSPPMVLPGVADVIQGLAGIYQEDMGESHLFSVTSAIRSRAYQARLAKQDRKLTIVSPDQDSSHLPGLAFDIDGCGLNQVNDGQITKINPNPEAGFWDPRRVLESQLVVRAMLASWQARDVLHYVEEARGTRQHCFHVCVNPHVL